ncbi:MAG: ABC transporter ATP-binding protein [Oscillospiraceae bacterium]|jgi:iron complex transport system ATP-binding protein|nr:ABC transporter ATP-binding protein [Oscillospiraceae bacterium]
MLNVSHVRAGYGSDEILHDVSLQLPMGQSLSIIGPNGCGKTTLLRAIAALIPFEGEITLGGKSVASMKRREIAARIAVMSQMASVYLPYTVYDTVMLGRYQHMKRTFFGRPSENDRRVADLCIEKTGLADIRDRRIDELSGGQLQRVFLAHTLAQEPQIILLDEPTNHLDMKHQVELISYLRDWASDAEHAVIGVFHDINLAMNLTENVLFLKDGNVVGQGLFEDVATPEFLHGLFDMDVVGYMEQSYGRWKTLKEGRKNGQTLQEQI